MASRHVSSIFFSSLRFLIVSDALLDRVSSLRLRVAVLGLTVGPARHSAVPIGPDQLLLAIADVAALVGLGEDPAVPTTDGLTLSAPTHQLRYTAEYAWLHAVRDAVMYAPPPPIIPWTDPSLALPWFLTWHEAWFTRSLHRLRRADSHNATRLLRRSWRRWVRCHRSVVKESQPVGERDRRARGQGEGDPRDAGRAGRLQGERREGLRPVALPPRERHEEWQADFHGQSRALVVAPRALSVALSSSDVRVTASLRHLGRMCAIAVGDTIPHPDDTINPLRLPVSVRDVRKCDALGIVL